MTYRTYRESSRQLASVRLAHARPNYNNGFHQYTNVQFRLCTKTILAHAIAAIGTQMMCEFPTRKLHLQLILIHILIILLKVNLILVCNHLAANIT